jgi:DNA-binding GntR family transcriptional regulator
MASMTVAGDPIVAPPSLVDLAAEALRKLILSGQLRPGDRVVENQLTQQLGISRPPLREAMRILEHQGLIRQLPRRGAVVTPLTLHDVYEIFTLRQQLERMTAELAVPVQDKSLYKPVREALELMEKAAADGDRAALSEHAFDFHVAIVGLSGHRRLVEAYRSLHLQMLQCMALNREVREREGESMEADVERHRRLLAVIESGDRAAVLKEFANHGDLRFVVALGDTLEPGSAIAQAWLAGLAGGMR